jgi:hypothetical protein
MRTDVVLQVRFAHKRHAAAVDRTRKGALASVRLVVPLQIALPSGGGRKKARTRFNSEKEIGAAAGSDNMMPKMQKKEKTCEHEGHELDK